MRSGYVAFLASALLLSACSAPDTESMQRGLTNNGMSAAQAGCYAGVLKEIIGTEEYNYLAGLMVEGASQKDAITRTRRKYGADFKTAMRTSSDKLDSCLQ